MSKDEVQNQVNFSTTGLKGRLLIDEPMSRHTSWRAGGPAKWFYTPAGLDDLGEFLKRIPQELPVAWCGLGSNLLVRDGGFKGAIVSTLKGLSKLQLAGKTGVYAQAGVPGAKVARYAAESSLCGAEFLAGIPGTVGGALAMNAGCFGSETWDIVSYVDTIDRSTTQVRQTALEVEYGYRYVKKSKDVWYTGARFELTPCDSTTGKKSIKKLLKERTRTQPIQTANAGSVFRNPPNDYAARLVESVGLKNYKIGNARISPKHANFIENRNKATAKEIEDLIDLTIKRVKATHGVQLIPEVKIIGTPLTASVV